MALIVVCVVIAACAAGFVIMEHRKMDVRKIALIAVMTAMSVAGRFVFAALPGFKPVTAVVVLCGMYLGADAGFICGALSALISNCYFGQGPWTPWQMFAYGMAGVCAGLLKKREIHTMAQVLLTAVYGFFVVLLIVGPILDTSSLFMMANVITKETAGAVYLSGLPVNAIHGVVTFITLLLFCRPLLEKLNRMKQKYGIMNGK